MHKTMKHLGRRLGVNGPGLTVAVIALVVALAGGAYAASGALTGKQKKEVTKIAKKYAGEDGKTGAQGPAGPAGPAGAKGDTGSQGQGLAGKEGEKGKDGVGVTSTESLGPVGPCLEGGSKFVSASGTTYACNGAEGPEGPEGKPWTAGGTLPPGATETGTWALNGTTADTSGIHVAISFPIKLAAELLPGQVHYSTESGFATHCPGVAAFPFPEPGNLCVYESLGDGLQNTEFKGICPTGFAIEPACLQEGEKGASLAGATLVFSAPSGVAMGSGAFGVSAPCETGKVPVFIETSGEEGWICQAP